MQGGRDDRGIDRRSVLSVAGTAVLAGLTGCSGGSDDEASTVMSSSPTTATTSSMGTGSGTEMASGTPSSTATEAPVSEWERIELAPVRGGDTFTFESLRGKPVLLETFAVWCPVCLKQQTEIEGLTVSMEDIVPVSLNIDPNEDASKVKRHAQRHGFGWRFAISPPELTKALVDAFGPVITSPPSAPVIRICPSGEAKLIEGSGVKSTGQLVAAFDEC